MNLPLRLCFPGTWAKTGPMRYYCPYFIDDKPRGWQWGLICQMSCISYGRSSKQNVGQSKWKCVLFTLHCPLPVLLGSFSKVQSWHPMTAGNLWLFCSLHSLSRLPLPHNLYLTERPSFDPHFITPDPLSAQVCRTAPCPSHMFSGWLQSVPLFVIPVSLCNTFSSPYVSRTDSTLPLVAELNYHHFHEVFGFPKLKQHFSPLN